MGNTSEYTDLELLHGFVDAYLDDALPEELKDRYLELLKKEENTEIPVCYGKARGGFQMIMHDYSLTEDQKKKFYNFVEDDEARAKHEDSNISKVGQVELFGNILRSAIIFGGFLLLIFGAVFYLSPEKKASFDVLNSLKWEAMSMEDEDSEWRVDLPTNDLQEAQDYLVKYPELGFTYKSIKSIGSQWDIEGASVIDYESAKVAVLQFSRPGKEEKLFIFFCEGVLEDLERSEQANHKGLLYQAYGTNDINIISWQYTDRVLGVIVSHESGPQMAELARRAAGIH